VGNRRQAFYTNLSPGNYRFRVAASNNSGVWNEAGTFLDFSVAPAYYQTIWFRSLCVAAFLAMLWALYQLRLRQVAQQFNMRMEERVNERLRIARELHDTMLQSFQAAVLHFQAVADLIPKRPQEAQQKLDSALDLADHAIAEGRDAVQGLRSSTTVTNDIAAAMVTLGKELAGNEALQNCPEFRVEVEGATCDLHPITRDEVCRIAREALRNAFKHAQATRIEVEIQYDPRKLRLRIRDNGKGFETLAVGDKSRPGHYGLPGMQERAKLIGGNLELWTKVQAGTEVELTIPAAAAYAKSAGAQRARFFRKGAGED
jgi:signal transduction histidine kinase